MLKAAVQSRIPLTAEQLKIRTMPPVVQGFILTDNASQFQEIFKEALQHLGIDDRKIHPYSHEENAIVERTNKEVERHLRNIMFHEKVHERWDEFCPIVE